MFPSIPLTYRDRERENAKLDNQFIDRKNTLHNYSAANSTPHSRDVQARLMNELNLLSKRDIAGQLKVAQKCFSEIIQQTKIHEKSLLNIKSNYEEFIFFNGELQLTNDLPTLSLDSRTIAAKRQEIVSSHSRLGKKESEAYRLHLENERLRNDLSEQIRCLEDIEAQNRVESKEDLTVVPSQVSLPDLSNLPQKEQVERLHMLYHKQEEIICDLKDELKRRYVPAVECKQVEMCIKDVEVSIQKEKRLNESLTVRLDDLVLQVYSLLSELSFSQKDIDKIIQSILNNSILSLISEFQQNNQQ